MIGNNQKQNTRGGFTILYSLLIISLLISISLGIFDIALRDFALAQSSAASHVALYAADAGMECALYYDLKYLGGNLAFATSSVNPRSFLGPGFTHQCGFPRNGIQPLTLPSSNSITGAYTTTITVYVSPSDASPMFADIDGPCAAVTVIKSNDGNSTTIDSRGYNICTNSTGATKRVERGLRAAY